MRESIIEKRVCQYAEDNGFITYKFVSPGRAHVPDRIFIDTTGRIFFIEFKATGEEPRPAQVREIERMMRNKAMVFVVDDIDYGKGIINGFINER